MTALSSLHALPRKQRHQALLALATGLRQERSVISSWVTADPNSILSVLRSKSFEIPDWRPVVGGAEKALGVPLPNLRRASALMPVGLTGKALTAVRGELARFLAEKLKELQNSLPSLITMALQPFTSSGRVEIVAAVVRPLVGEIAKHLLEAEVPKQILQMSLIGAFPSIKSPHTIKRMETEFADVFRFLESISQSETDLQCKLCALVFGIDSLTMLLVENLVAAFEDGQQQYLQLEGYPAETGVPVTSRQVAADVDFGAVTLKRGDMVRLQLQGLCLSNDPAHKAGFFGAGAHACIGRQLSLFVWAEFAKQFNALSLRGRLLERKTKPSLWICLYDQVFVEVEHVA